MKIDRKLNLVYTVEDGEKPVHIHSAPLSPQVFDTYFLTITKAYAAMAGLGGEWMIRMGPRNAMRMLKRVAEANGIWASTPADPMKGVEAFVGVDVGLVAEIHRLANAVILTDTGWSTIPLQEAIDKKLIGAEDLSEVDNALCFFTVACASLRPAEADSMLSAAFGVYGGQLTSSNATVWAASLPTSTADESSGEKAKASSIPH